MLLAQDFAIVPATMNVPSRVIRLVGVTVAMPVRQPVVISVPVVQQCVTPRVTPNAKIHKASLVFRQVLRLLR